MQLSSVSVPSLRHLHAQQVAELHLRYVVGYVFLFVLFVSTWGFGVRVRWNRIERIERMGGRREGGKEEEW